MTRPTPAELLEIARSTLLADVLPLLQGDARFKLLMAANAMAIGQRALLAAPVDPLDDPALCAAIRSGGHDDDGRLGQKLLETAEAQCRVSAPKAVK